MNIEVWSDIGCPFCYIADTRLKKAIAALHAEDIFTVVMRSFELNPDVKEPESCVSHYAKAYNAAPEKVAANLRKIGQTAAEDGLTFHYDRAICANTFNAHRLAKYAEANGRPEMMDRLFEAYFRDCLDVSDRNVLESLARKEGLDTAFLDTDAYYKEVQEDELDARRMGIYAVPYFVINREYTFDGAMPQQFFNNVLLGVMKRSGLVPPEGKGVTCGPNGCTFR